MHYNMYCKVSFMNVTPTVSNAEIARTTLAESMTISKSGTLDYRKLLRVFHAVFLWNRFFFRKAHFGDSCFVRLEEISMKKEPASTAELAALAHVVRYAVTVNNVYMHALYTYAHM